MPAVAKKPAAQDEHSNGQADDPTAVMPDPNRAEAPRPVPPAPRPAMPRQEWVEVAPEEYPGYSLLLWLNYPQSLHKVMIDLLAGEDARRAAFGRVVLQHNDWPHPETGEPLPPPQDPAFWAAIDQRLANLIWWRLQAEVNARPNSIRKRLLD